MPKQNRGQQNIVKGAMILSLSIIITKIIGILYRLPVTDALGDVGNGIYSVAYQVYIIIITVTSIGLPSAISKLVSERCARGSYKEANRVYQIAMVYTMVLASILSIALWFGADYAAGFFKIAEAAGPIRALVPAVIIVSIMAVMKGYFQGMQMMKPTAVAQVIEQMVHAVVSIILAYGLLQFGLEAAVVGSTLGVAVGALFGVAFLGFVYYLLRGRIHKQMKKDRTEIEESSMDILKKILATSIPIMLSASVFSVMTTLDYGMMGNMLPATVEKLRATNQLVNLPVATELLGSTDDIVKSLTGIFSLKYMTILNLPVSLILTLGMAATPAIAASMATGNVKEVKQKTNMIFKIGMLFAAPSAIGLAFFGKEIVAFLLPSQPYGGELLAYGGIGILFITLAQLSAGILQGMGKQTIPTRNALIACGIKVVMNLILLRSPSIHIYGVVHSTTLCYFIYAFLNISYLTQVVPMKFKMKRIVLKPIGVALVMGIVAKLLYTLLSRFGPFTNLWLILSIGVAAIVYGLLGVMTGTITAKDIRNIPGGNKLLKRH